MLRPKNFGFNIETKVTNSFQHKINESPEIIKEKALMEFNNMANNLIEQNVNIDIIEDKSEILPDAIFLNNWLSFFPDGKLIIYPVKNKIRRQERRTDVIDYLIEKYDVTEFIDLTAFEDDNEFLESTGSVVFDYKNKTAYCTSSPRSSEKVFNELCNRIGYKGFYFNTENLDGSAIYHTNVMMNIFENLVVICSDAISNNLDKAMVLESIKLTGRQILDISFQQLNQFAANIFEVFDNQHNSIIVMSRTAHSTLTDTQINTIEIFSKILIVNISIIERVGGGSARCMLTAVNC